MKKQKQDNFIFIVLKIKGLKNRHIFSKPSLRAVTWTHFVHDGSEIPKGPLLASVASKTTCKRVTGAKQRTESRVKRTTLLLVLSKPSLPAYVLLLFYKIIF